MQIKHHHPSFPHPEDRQQELNHVFTSCVKKLRQEIPTPSCRPVPGKYR